MHAFGRNVGKVFKDREREEHTEEGAKTIGDAFFNYMRYFFNYDAPESFRPINKIAFDFSIPKGDFGSFVLCKIESISNPSFVS